MIAILAAAATMIGLDMIWLNVVAKRLYASALGSLERPEPFVPAALAFYAMYLAATLVYAVRGASSVKSAAARGAGLGFVAYATYELTNWAVLAGWPAALVPIDILWGVVLTSCAAAAGKWAERKTPQPK